MSGSSFIRRHLLIGRAKILRAGRFIRPIGRRPTPHSKPLRKDGVPTAAALHFYVLEARISGKTLCFLLPPVLILICDFEQANLAYWPAPGFEDTELGVLMEPEVSHGEAEVYTRVQARGYATDQRAGRVVCPGLARSERASTVAWVSTNPGAGQLSC
jgi:hypothetical protein